MDKPWIERLRCAADIAITVSVSPAEARQLLAEIDAEAKRHCPDCNCTCQDDRPTAAANGIDVPCPSCGGQGRFDIMKQDPEIYCALCSRNRCPRNICTHCGMASRCRVDGVCPLCRESMALAAGGSNG
jgi:hypothetical protein